MEQREIDRCAAIIRSQSLPAMLRTAESYLAPAFAFDADIGREVLGEAATEIERLRDALRYMRGLADEVHSHWDADNDSKVGKLLLAMSGRLPKYRDDIDKVLALIPAKQGNGGGG